MTKVEETITEAIELVEKDRFKGALLKVNDIFGEIHDELEVLAELEYSVKNFNLYIERAKIGIESILTHDAKYCHYESTALEELKKQVNIEANLNKARILIAKLSDVLERAENKINKINKTNLNEELKLI